jgi:cell division protein FtsQ
MNDDAPLPLGARVARALRWTLALALLAGLAATPWWVQELTYFHVRRVEITGTRFVPPADLLAALALDSSSSVWQRLGPLAARVEAHPQVLEATLRRKLPGTLVVAVRENLPVALVEGPEGLRPFDREGRPLPIDPSRTPLDLPVVAEADTGLLRLLGDLRADAPALFARVSAVRRDEAGGMRVLLTGVEVRAAAGISAARFLRLLDVEADLRQRGVRARELDLRYRDQIVARIE